MKTSTLTPTMTTRPATVWRSGSDPLTSLTEGSALGRALVYSTTLISMTSSLASTRGVQRSPSESP